MAGPGPSAIEIAARIRDMGGHFVRALEHAQDVIGQIIREHWRRQILTIVGGPANKIAYITGAYWDSIYAARAVDEGGQRVIQVVSDRYQDTSVWAARAPGIGHLIEAGAPGYPGRFQGQAAIESSEADVQAQLAQHVSLAIRMLE